MATYLQIPLAGNIAATWAFKLGISGSNMTDITQLTAWDDYNMTTIIKEALAGTAGNGNKSSICITDTTSAPATNGWATSLAQTGGAASSNRCKGTTAYCTLGTVGMLYNAPGSLTLSFQMAVGIASDFVPGALGHDPVLGVRVFYTSSVAPIVVLGANITVSDSSGATFTAINMQSKGIATIPALPNAILPAGASSTSGHLNPITVPDAGEIFASNYYIQTA